MGFIPDGAPSREEKQHPPQPKAPGPLYDWYELSEIFGDSPLAPWMGGWMRGSA